MLLVGKIAENYAASCLQAQGLRLLSQNFKCKLGEIDLIMQDKDTIVFIEVRYRTVSHFGSSLESIHAAKRKKIIKTAYYYLQLKGWMSMLCRFDFFVIDKDQYKKDIKTQWIKHAFSLTGLDIC